MQKFLTLTGLAAHLPMINVATDMSIHKQYLKANSPSSGADFYTYSQSFSH